MHQIGRGGEGERTHRLVQSSEVSHYNIWLEGECQEGTETKYPKVHN